MSANTNENELWMVPYADLMSTLVILFLALYGFAAMKQQAEKEKPELRHKKEVAVTEEEKKQVAAREKEAALAEDLEKALKDRLPKDAASLRVDEDRVALTLSSPLLFDSDSAELRPEIQPFLGRMAEALRQLPNGVVVEGHTDAVPVHGGPFPSNFELSAARAYAVVDFLAKAGVPPERFSIYGYAGFRPVDTNKTPEGRAHNRRIEIALLRNSGTEGKEGKEGTEAKTR